ncbi:hypothetical protein G5V59_10300 [Nocardioides sp. W3-2-3]|nr:hypothetical protein [Nocardioides convexus]
MEPVPRDPLPGQPRRRPGQRERRRGDRRRRDRRGLADHRPALRLPRPHRPPPVLEGPARPDGPQGAGADRVGHRGRGRGG